MRARFLWLLLLVLACLALTSLSARESQAAALPLKYVVDTNSDMAVANGCSDVPAGNCSLREAITESNAGLTTRAHIISFAIGSGPQTIITTAQLPYITQEVDVDGITQPQASDCAGAGRLPCITIAGPGVDANQLQDGFVINSRASHVTIEDMSIVGYSSGVWVADGTDAVISNNYLGTTDGSLATPNKYGVYIAAVSTGATVGGPGGENIISGNTVAGVQIDGNNNVVQGNFIGTNKLGTAPLANGDGVIVAGQSNTVGVPTEPASISILGGGRCHRAAATSFRAIRSMAC